MRGACAGGLKSTGGPAQARSSLRSDKPAVAPGAHTGLRHAPIETGGLLSRLSPARIYTGFLTASQPQVHRQEIHEDHEGVGVFLELPRCADPGHVGVTVSGPHLRPALHEEVIVFLGDG